MARERTPLKVRKIYIYEIQSNKTHNDLKTIYLKVFSLINSISPAIVAPYIILYSSIKVRKGHPEVNFGKIVGNCKQNCNKTSKLQVKGGRKKDFWSKKLGKKIR